MNTEDGMMVFGIGRLNKSHNASYGCTKASFVICDNLAGLSLPTGLGVAIKNERAVTSNMRDY